MTAESTPEPGWRQAALALPRLIALVGKLVTDQRVPMRHRMVAVAALGYTVSPIDIIPDAIPVLGQTDDILVVALALRTLLRGAGPEVVAEHWDGSDDVLEIVEGVIEWAGGLVPRPLRFMVERWTAAG